MQEIYQIRYNGYFYHHSIDDIQNGSEFSLHCHQSYEIYYFIHGAGSFFIEGNRYELKRNSILIMRPGEFHCFKFEKPMLYERCALHFNIEYLSYIRLNDELLSPFLKHNLGENNLLLPGEDDNIMALFKRLDLCAALPENERILRSQFILGELLTCILNISRRNRLQQSDNNTNILANNLIEYINTNIRSVFSLEQLADTFFVNKYYLSHVFKKHTGVSILEYIIRKKIHLASKLLEEGIKATKVSEQCGFGDYSTFYRSYKRITGVSPGSTAQKDRHMAIKK